MKLTINNFPTFDLLLPQIFLMSIIYSITNSPFVIGMINITLLLSFEFENRYLDNLITVAIVMFGYWKIAPLVGPRILTCFLLLLKWQTIIEHSTFAYNFALEHF